MELKEFVRENPRAVLGFSGGVDSAYLLYVGIKEGADWRPVYLRTVFQPAFELADARRMCEEELGVDLTVLDEDILSDPMVCSNPADRCYYCKQKLFGRIADWARMQKIPLVLDGNNASDAPDDRPGMRAAKELGVRSPLREAGLNKEEIRRLSREAGLFTWNKPSYACLATRIPEGTPLDSETLKRVEFGEDALRGLGFSDLRIRVYHGAARLQLPEEQMETVIRKRETVLHALKPVFPAIMLDLEARAGLKLPPLSVEGEN